MKKNLLVTLVLCICIPGLQAQNVPNGGFENWTAGNPDSWYTTNVTSIAIPVTQETPSYTGNYAVRGTVVTNAIIGPIRPFISTTDATGYGFPVSQAYTTLSFYYKMNVTGTIVFSVTVLMRDAATNTVGVGWAFYSGNVSSFTAAGVPIYYSGPNPVECVIVFELTNTIEGPMVPGDYFVVDDAVLSSPGTTSIQEPAPSSINAVTAYPNPVSHSAAVQYNLVTGSDVQFEILNSQGKIVQEKFFSENSAGRHETTFDVATLPVGFYFLRMKTNRGTSFASIQVAR